MPNKPPRRAVDRLQTRINSLERQASDESGFVVSDANTAFARLHAAAPAVPSVLIRSGFVARHTPMRIGGDRDATPRVKPPAANIIRSRGVALKLELALLFVAQTQKRVSSHINLPVVAPDESDDLGLINLFATGTNVRGQVNYRRTRPAMRAKQIHTALEILAANFLVDLGPMGQGRPFTNMFLMNEAGRRPAKDPVRYTFSPGTSPISVPIEFFTNGWIQVMTDSEIWNWLAFRHRAGMANASITSATGVTIDADTRLSEYDLTRDAWDTHLMLDRLGLMTAVPGDVTSESTSRGQRFRKEPHAFDLDDDSLTADAHSAVLAAVAAIQEDLLDG